MNKHPHIAIEKLSHGSFGKAVLIAGVLSALVVTSISFLARATYNVRAGLTEKPDVGIYQLLEDEHLMRTKLLREQENERDYLAETPEGPKLIKLKKGQNEWYVSVVEKLHEQ